MDNYLCSNEIQLQTGFNIPNPLAQAELSWLTIEKDKLLKIHSQKDIRWVDPGGIFKLTENILGSPKQYCILSKNVIGVTNWESTSIEQQYYAVNKQAGAFLAAAMYYMKISGENAGKLLDILSPRKINTLQVNSAKFVLFTTPDGTVDEEAIVIRTAEDEYIMSCGGGKPPTFLAPMMNKMDNVYAEECNLISFNIKGPARLQAVQSLMEQSSYTIIEKLKNFDSCIVLTKTGTQARVLKTVIGYEVWAEVEVLTEIWKQLITENTFITPCAWDLLNIYRMECADIVFGLYPVDLHAQTTLHEINCGWMLKEKCATESYIGKEALHDLDGHTRFKLVGVIQRKGNLSITKIGQSILNANGKNIGVITSSALSPKWKLPVSFAHILSTELTSFPLLIDGNIWEIEKLPFANTLFHHQ